MTHVLLGEWGFLDNLDDTSGHGITASVNFSPSYIDGPVTGTRAIKFSGANQSINYGRTGLEPIAADGGIITMAWMKLFSSHSSYAAIVHKTRASDSTRHGLDIEDNGMFFVSRWRDQLALRGTGDEFDDFGWHHICNVDANDRYAWFIDGAKIQESARSGDSPVNWEDFPWLTGYAPAMDSMNSSANLAVTGVRILSGTLSDSEVIDWMDTPIVPAGRSGKPKVWNGSAWIKHQAKVWDGGSWVAAPMSGYNGTDWVASL